MKMEQKRCRQAASQLTWHGAPAAKSDAVHATIPLPDASELDIQCAAASHHTHMPHTTS